MNTKTITYAKSWQQLALHMVHQRKAAYDAYEEDVRDWYKNGDGRSTRDGGRGFTYPYCFHGVSRWVDYDCACGSCEDGWGSFDYLRELEVAKETAKDAFLDMKKRIDLYVDLTYKIKYGDMPVTIDKERINEWVQAPIEMRK